MFSPQLRGFLYGVLITTSLVSVITYASGTDGVFGDYFENIVTDASTCGTDYVITGFYDTPANFGKQKCTTFQNIVKSIISPHLPIEGKAVTGFMNDGTPIYGDVNWHKDASENLSYTGAGNVGIGTNSPGATLSIAGSNDNGIRIDKTSGSSYNYMEWLIGGVRSYWNGLDNNGKYTIQSDTNDAILLAPTGGNVGIGTATPSEALEVNGNMSVSGAITTDVISINDIQEEGDLCSPDGSISRDSTGAILSCQLGRWKSQDQQITQKILEKTLQLDVTDKVMGDRTFPDFISCFYSSTQYQITFYFHLNDINSDYVRYRDMSGGRAIDFVRSTRQYQDSTSAGDCAHQSIDDLIAANRAAGY